MKDVRTAPSEKLAFALAYVTLFAVGIVALAGAGCEAPPPVSPDSEDPTEVMSIDVGLAGVPTMGYPSYEERLQLVAQNRTRSDPNNVAAGTSASCSVSHPAQPPLVYNFDAGQAARFHCANSHMNGGGLTHDSYCDLRSDIEATGCTGASSCGCNAGTECFTCTTLGGCGTDAFSRMSLFGFGGSGENGAAGYSDSWSAVEGWVTECPPADGHRSITTSSSYNVVGTGEYGAGGGCWSAFYFSDYGFIGGTVIPRIPSGVHRPETGSASTTYTFYANWYDTAGAPSMISVVVDGMCLPMTSELGSGGNRTYTYAGTFPSGCHEYWFLATSPAARASRTPPPAPTTSTVASRARAPTTSRRRRLLPARRPCVRTRPVARARPARAAPRTAAPARRCAGTRCARRARRARAARPTAARARRCAETGRARPARPVRAARPTAAPVRRPAATVCATVPRRARAARSIAAGARPCAGTAPAPVARRA